MKKKPKATILILNWNGEKFLRDNLPSVLAQTYANYDVLLVDNGSTDDSRKVMQEFERKDSRVHILETGENLGYVGGNNYAMKKIIKQGTSDYIVILNNDVRLSNNWLEELLAGFDNASVGICTSKILFYYPFEKIQITPLKKDVQLKNIQINNVSYFILEFKSHFLDAGKMIYLPKTLKRNQTYFFAVACDTSLKKNLRLTCSDGTLKIKTRGKNSILHTEGSVNIKGGSEYVLQNAGSMLNKHRMTFDERYNLFFDRKLESRYVDAACGAAMAVRTDLLKRFGLFREKYFMYYEDSELSYRFKKQGFTTKFMKDAVCYHYYIGSHKGKILPKHMFYGVKNKLWFTRRYFGLLPYLFFSMKALARSCILFFQIPFKNEAKNSFKAYIRAFTSSLAKDT